MEQRLGSFDLLTPQAILSSLEQAFDLVLDGTLSTYPSYINRVYGVRTEEGREYVCKFYRPGRWEWEAILAEHSFVLECTAEDIPVIPPLPDADGDTLCEVEVAGPEDSETFAFALYPKRGGRSFDAEGDDQWLRLGSIVGRCHAVGRRKPAPERPVCTPAAWTAPFVRELLDQGLVHPDIAGELADFAEEQLALLEPLFTGVDLQRIHGDCHRGNLLERPGEGLMIIDFDDMMTGPPVQDIWLLLPGYAADCGRELTFLLEGYERFLDFPRETLRLIEPLRLMRMIHFLAWQARQREDHWFRREYPDWGTKQFWIREMEDLQIQARVVGDDDSFSK